MVGLLPRVLFAATVAVAIMASTGSSDAQSVADRPFNPSTFLAQTPVPAPAAPTELAPEKQPLTFLFNVRSRNYYDSWSNDLIAECLRSDSVKRPCGNIGRPERDNSESGSQFSTKIDLFGRLGQFELNLTTGRVETEYNRKAAERIETNGTVTSLSGEAGSNSFSGFTDTEINFAFNNFDQKGWGLEIGVRANLPTGMTQLTKKQLFSLPSEDVVSSSALGQGFNIGPGVKVWKQSGAYSWYFGGRFLYLGDYDLTKNEDPATSRDGVPAGWEGALDIGFNHPNWRMGYSFIDQNRGESSIVAYSNLLFLGLNSDLTKLGWFWRADANVSYNIVDTGLSSVVERSQTYQEGFQGSLEAELGYKWSVFSLSALGGIKGSSSRDVQNQFVNPTSQKLWVGAAANWDLFRTAYGNVTLNGQFKYSNIVSTQAVDNKGNLLRGGRDDITWDSWTIFGGISYSFVKLF
jgi:hypothetical protein